VPSAAPEVDTRGLTLVGEQANQNQQLSVVAPSAATASSGRLLQPGARKAYVNLPLAQMHAPLVGPTRNGGTLAAAGGTNPHQNFNSRSGHVEDVGVADFHFDDQIATFDNKGWAADAGGRGGIVGDARKFAESGGVTAMVSGGGGKKRRGGKKNKKKNDASAADEEDSEEDPDAAWAPKQRRPWMGKEVKSAKPTAEQVAWLKKGGFIEEEEGEEGGEGGGQEGAAAAAAASDSTPLVTTSTAAPVPASAIGFSQFHPKASQQSDALGRSWACAPQRAARRGAPEKCQAPRRLAKSIPGAHSGKGVAAVRYFPKTGHLLLSAGLDGKAKIWDTGSSDAADRFVGGGGGGEEFSYRCWRSYSPGVGSTTGSKSSSSSSSSAAAKGLRDANFDSVDGLTFATASYDKHVKVWDTETGRVSAVLGNGKGMFYCVTYHPGGGGNDDNQDNSSSSMGKHVILAGCSDKKIYQFDTRSGDVVQEYDYHLGAVNTVTFFDSGKRFASTSDDKTIRVWEFGIPVQTRVLADPEMHAVPAATSHPLEPYIAMQSMDNRVLTYSTRDKFRANNKKTFSGHTVAGYACRPCFSPDGRFIASGDGQGKCFVWDWGSTRVSRSFQAHEPGTVCIDVAWHPLEESRIATAGWDGSVRFWE
jgi:pre-mRNA-processing factor 17